MIGIWQVIMIVNLGLIVASIIRLVKIKPALSFVTLCWLLAIFLVPVIGSIVFLVRNPRSRQETAE